MDRYRFARVTSHHRLPLRALTIALASLALLLLTRRADADGSFAVTKIADTNDGVCAPADCSLREAISAARSTPGLSTVSLPPGAYALSLGALTLGGLANQSITVQGTTTAAATTVQGNGTHSVFITDADPSHPNQTFAFRNLTITGGLAPEGSFGGGAIQAGGPGQSVTVDGSVLHSNTSRNQGGGAILHAGGGNLTIVNSTIRDNLATAPSGAGNLAFGGGVQFAGSGSLTVRRSTFSGNTAGAAGMAPGAGGAIHAGGAGAVSIATTAFVGNRALDGALGAQGSGGAIRHTGPALILQYSRLRNNTASAGSAVFFAALSAAALDARENWWGANSGPPLGSVVTGTTPATAIPTPPALWLQLRLRANPATVPAGQTAALTADLYAVNDGSTIIAGRLNDLPAFPEPAATIFSNPQLGTLSAATMQFIHGIATATFTAGVTTGTGGASATADGQTVNVAITVSPRPTRPDVNGDGSVTSTDALCILRQLGSFASSTNCPVPLPFPDVNFDGAVTSVDALCVLRYLGSFPATTACPLHQ